LSNRQNTKYESNKCDTKGNPKGKILQQLHLTLLYLKSFRLNVEVTR
jgi:hypothetical protein